MKNQEASGNLQQGEILFPSSKASYMKMKTKNDGKSENLGLGRDPMCLAHGIGMPSHRAWLLPHSHAPSMLTMCPVHLKNVRRNRLFLLLFWVKPALLAQTQLETLTINPNLPHSEFLV
jgi:hypothetical protein